MKRIWLILLLILILLPFKINAQSSNAGFVPGNIWYSKDSLEEGDKIKIYTVLFNPDTREFSGTVIFFDKNTFLGKKNFTIGSRTVKDISIDWTVTVGDHTIFAKIENAKFLISSNKYEEVFLAGNQSEESKISINKKIIVKDNTVDSNETILDRGSESIKNLGKMIEEKTPEIIAKPIIATASGIENFRENIGDASKNTKEAIKKEFESMKNTQNSEKTVENGKLSTPFKYIKLFFFSLISFIFNSKLIFYGLLLGIIFFLLRYLWHLIF